MESGGLHDKRSTQITYVSWTGDDQSSCSRTLSLVKLLGGGSYGVVFSAIRNSPPRAPVVALKVLHDHDDESTISRENGIRLLQLVHENIVRYTDVGTTEWSPKMDDLVHPLVTRTVFEMEYCEGGRFKDHIRKYVLSNDVIILYAKQLLEGLHYLHTDNKHGIIHTDFKSENVFLSAHLRVVKIGDLDGCICVKNGRTTKETITKIRGTYSTMAPEMAAVDGGALNDDPAPGRLSDIWSYGCVLLDMATGQNTTWRKDGYTRRDSEVNAYHISEGFRPHVPGEIQPKLKDLIITCLLPAPPSSDKEFAEGFRPRTPNLREHHCFSCLEKLKFPAEFEKRDLVSARRIHGMPESVWNIPALKSVSSSAPSAGSKNLEIVNRLSAEIKFGKDQDGRAFWRAYRAKVLKLQEISHPNVCVLHDCWMSNEKITTTMEHYAGNSIAQMLQIPDFHLRSAKWVKDLIGGLLYLHSQSIIHENLNSSNILLDSKDFEAGTLKISGFLQTDDLHQDHHSNDCFPEWLFHSPKRVQKNRACSSMDIWSLGCVMIHVLTGKLPTFTRLPSTLQTSRKAILCHIAEGNRPNIDGILDSDLRNRLSTFFNGEVTLDELCKNGAIQCINRYCTSTAFLKTYLAPVSSHIKIHENQGCEINPNPRETGRRRLMARPDTRTSPRNLDDFENSYLTAQIARKQRHPLSNIKASLTNHTSQRNPNNPAGYYKADRPGTEKQHLVPHLSVNSGNRANQMRRDHSASLSSIAKVRQQQSNPQRDVCQADMQEHTGHGLPIYELVRILASNTQKTVYLAKVKDEFATKYVAVKRIQLSLDQNQRDQETALLDDKISSLTSLLHPNIVRHLGGQLSVPRSAFEPATYDILMGFCAGGTLDAAIRKREFNNRLPLQRWIRDVLAGLDYLHSHSIVHRDLSSNSIFLSSPNHVDATLQIGDLGNFKQLHAGVTGDREVSYARGTNRCMSPEMIQGYSRNVRIGQKTDIWSLGCVIIEMVTRRTLQFSRVGNNRQQKKVWIKSLPAIMVHVGNGKLPDIPKQLPVLLEYLIRECLDPDENTRPSALELFCHGFFYMSYTDIAHDMDRFFKLQDSDETSFWK